MLAGETAYVLIIEEDGASIATVYAHQQSAVAAWIDALNEALVYADIESLDELDVYEPGVYFMSPNGTIGRVEAVEVE